MRIYTQYDPPPGKAVSFVGDRDRTRQSEAAATDVNAIVSRFRVTGMLPQRQDAFFADVCEIGDYRAAVAQVTAADRRFGSLPAEVRSRFANDPAAFVDFCLDPRNEDELVRLKLLEPRSELPAPPGAPTA